MKAEVTHAMFTRRVLPEAQRRIRHQLEAIHDRVTADGPLTVGQHGQAVKALEGHLAAAGLFKGEADGVYDDSTKRAVAALQREKHLAPTGEVNFATYQAVKSLDLFVKKGFHPAAKEGQRGLDIRRAEKRLDALGYRRARPDGLFTHNTTIAVRQFQRAYGLKASGQLTPGTSAMLERLSSSRKTLGYINGVPRRITVTSVGNGEFMRTDAARSFLKMQAAAKRAGVSLSAGSGFRTMAEQKYLYALYLSGRGNLAARPGYSNHQGGIAMDVNGVGGYGTRAYSWLSHNAKRFGFVNDVGGEYWHWTYQR